MHTRWLNLTACLSLLALGCCGVALGNVTNFNDRPLLAVWRNMDGSAYAPRLRFAIWEDGRIVFSKEAPRWGTNLFAGRFTAGQLASLKERVRATGIFNLARASEMGPSDPWCCLLIAFDKEERLFDWSEEGLDYYWAERPPIHGSLPAGNFKRCWTQVNRIALSFSPEDVRRFEGNFSGAPNSWQTKRRGEAAEKDPKR